MELRHVSVFVAVAEELHFGRAGKRLHLSQPAVSRLVRQLEGEVGVALLNRTTRQVSLTPAGTAFLNDARRAVALLDGAKGRACRAASDGPSVLRIGYSECTEEWLPAVLRSMRKEDPAVRLEVRNVDRPAQLRHLIEGEIDAALRRAPVDDPAVETELLMSEPMVIVLPSRHHLVGEKGLRWQDVADAPFVVMPHSSGHARLQGAASAAGFTPRTAEEVFSLSSMLVLVSAGAGIALVPQSIARRFSSEDVVYCAVGPPVPTLPVMIAWRRSDVSPLVQSFLATVRTSLGSPFDVGRTRERPVARQA